MTFARMTAHARAARHRPLVALVAAVALMPALAACGPADVAAAFNASAASPSAAPAVPAPVAPAAAPATTAAATSAAATSAAAASPTGSAPAAPVAAVAAARPLGSSQAAVTAPASGSSIQKLQVGVTIFGLWRDQGMVNTLLDQTKAAGSSWVRMDLSWCSVEEAGSGKVSAWYQNLIDSTVAAANARGIKLLMTIHCTPAWARPSGSRDDAYPSDPGQFKRVSQYLATRYRGKIAAWEIWNEPDCVGGGGCPGGDPVPYVPVLKAGAAGIRAGDPGATVVSAGVSGNNAAWISRMYAAGAAGSFDALAVHPYMSPENVGPDAPRIGTNPYRMPNLADVKAVMDRNGDGGKPIWFTEFGWTTSQTTSNPGVDEATQARYLQAMVQLTQNSYPYVTNAFWYAMRDRDDASPWENLFGLMHVDGSPKPSLAAFKASNAWLAGL